MEGVSPPFEGQESLAIPAQRHARDVQAIPKEQRPGPTKGSLGYNCGCSVAFDIYVRSYKVDFWSFAE
jgi:hypothetical protein